MGIIVGALALVALLFAVVLSQPRESPPMDESRPAGVVHNYLLALLQDDPKRAYAYLAADAQARTPYEQFATRHARQTPRPRLTIDNERIEGDTARVAVRWSYPSGGPFFGGGEITSQQTLVLKLEGGAWKLTEPPIVNP
jgi:hypothetical protein